MATSRYGNYTGARERPAWLRLVAANAPLLIFLGLALAGMLAVYLRFNPTPGDAEVVASVMGEGPGLSAPIFKRVANRPVLQRFAQSPGPLHLALIAGHKDNDSGSVCADGLTEAAVTLGITQRVAAALQDAGIRTDIFAEFDPRLDGFSGTALVSIHADSCDYINDLATGFKIAGSSRTDSAALSICLQDAYAEATGLPYHANTITPHMTDYHAFREIAPGTPAVIIEVGFLYLDREMLTTQSDRPVAGIINGVRCYLHSIP